MTAEVAADVWEAVPLVFETVITTSKYFPRSVDVGV